MTDFNYKNPSFNKVVLPTCKPKIFEKNVRMINERSTQLKDNSIYIKEMQSELAQYWIRKRILPDDMNHDNINRKEHPKLENTVETESLSKLECITQECLTYINQVHSCLIYIMATKEELDEEFSNDGTMTKSFTYVFRDIQSLLSAYQIIQETIDKFRSDHSHIFYLYEVIIDPVVSSLLKMYKPFLNNYASIIKWTTEFNKDNQNFIEVCERVRRKSENMDNSSLDQCLYTVFNSLFSIELMFDRYRTCFEEASEQFQKATQAKELISSILKVMNTNQDQENFLLTQKELSFMTGRSRESRVNSRFICKGVVTKLSRRDDKPLQRQLILFSDCLYVTLLPSNILGSSSVRYELSIESMQLSEIHDGEVSNNAALQWGLTINAKEAKQDFYFDSEQIMKMWRTKVSNAIKEEANANAIENSNTVSSKESLGLEAPRWQKDSAAGFCNGYQCSQKFSTAIRRHHCRADGLLYCDSCCNFKVKLDFERSAKESKVCELCYNILCLYPNSAEQLAEARLQLDAVINKKTRTGHKIGWLKVKIFNKDKMIFHAEVKYFCELQWNAPILVFYEKSEDKYFFERVDFSELDIIDPTSSKVFLMEDNTKTTLYQMTATSREECESWIDSLKERIVAGANN